MPQGHGQYIFGNSLVNFAGGSPRANVPYWMDRFAGADGNSYAVNGSYGFLRDFADRPEPLSQWGFEGVDVAWQDGAEPFGQADFDSVIITPANFIQYQPPDAPYPGDTRAPLDAVAQIAESVGTAEPNARIMIYEGWADMAPFTAGFPPTSSELAAYHAYNLGPYHAWFETLVAEVNAADPDAAVTLLPVASILSELYTTTLADLPAEALYVDDAPHGTDTTYFLAAMVVYNAAYGSPAPALPDFPGGIDPAVATHYAEIQTTIENALSAAGVLGTPPAPDLPADADPDAEPVPDPDPPEVSDPGPYRPVDDGPVNDGPATEPPAPPPDHDRAPVPEEPVAEEPPADPLQEPGAEPPDPALPPPPDAPRDIAVAFHALDASVTSLDAVDFDAAPDGMDTVAEIAVYEDTDSPYPDGQDDHFAARYEAELTVDSAQSYTFTLWADDAARVYVNGEEVLRTEGAQIETFHLARIDLAEGRHDIRVDYLELTGEQTLNVEWYQTYPDEAALAAADAEPPQAGAALMALLAQGSDPQDQVSALDEVLSQEAEEDAILA